MARCNFWASTFSRLDGEDVPAEPLERRKIALDNLLRRSDHGIQLIEERSGETRTAAAGHGSAPSG